MPYDLKLSHFSLNLQKDVAAGQLVDREGTVLRSVLENGEEKVQLADGSAANYRVAGFAISDNETIGVIPMVEEAVIPANPGPYTIQLKYTSLVGTAPNSAVRVYDITDDTDLTETASLSPGAGQFNPNVATGLLTFNVAEESHAIRVFYRANLTVAQAKLKYFERFVNNTAGQFYNTVVVGSGTGEVFTAEYDTNVDWTTAWPAGTADILTGPNGILTIGGGGTPIPGAKVIHVPNVDNAMLGISFNLS